MPASSARACMAEFTAALLGRDLDAALDLIAEDALLFYSNGSVLRKADFAAVMSDAWKAVENYRYTTSGLTWLIEADATAVVVYGFEWSGTARNEPVSGRGRATRIFRKDEAGWSLAHEHLSAERTPG